MILRAGLDLQLSRASPEDDGLIAGSVELRDSLFLQDLRNYTRRGAAGVSRRPPYFAVEQAPWNAMRLDVALKGEDFLRVRTPVFQGMVSVDMSLGGSLGQPLLLGQAESTEGAFVFPFARLPVEEVTARITRDDPTTLKLQGSGEGVAFGYQLNLTLGGTDAEPELFLSSIPSLPPEAILLMLASGAVPSQDGAELGSTQRAGRLALFLGQDIFSDLLGGEGSNRLEIRTGDGLSPFRRTGNVLEYRLNDRWSVLGEYDEFGDYNIDFRRLLYDR